MFFSHTLVFHKYPLCITYHIYFLLSIGFIFDLYRIDITEFLLYYVLVITDKERSHMANGYNPLNDWFYLNRQTRKKGDRQSNLHYHHSYEIFIILRGSTTLLADDKLISVSKNEIVLLKPDDLHKNNGGTEHERYALHFTEHYLSQYMLPDAYQNLLNMFNNQKIHLDSAQFSSVIEIIQRMEQNPNYSYIHICELLTILSSYKNTEKKKVSEKHGTIDLILEYINKNYQTVLNLDDISDAVHISKPHLCKLFKQEMNITVSDYLNTVRINNACELLRNSKHSITDIATACGYNSSTYFCKTFRHIVHMSPNEYRKHIDTN